MKGVIKRFPHGTVAGLSAKAASSPRLRQHLNLHESFDDPCQRLLNAIEPGSYIRPHRHASDPKDELLVVLKGSLLLFAFSERGVVEDVMPLCSRSRGTYGFIGIEVPADVWHTVLAVEPGSVLLEVKAGPFNPSMPKDLASWAPAEGTQDATIYLQRLQSLAAQSVSDSG
jgi:cupin fold WbuC family metalloprotein